MHQIPLFCKSLRFADSQTNLVSLRGALLFLAFTPYTLRLISYFATSTWQNKFLEINVQQKVGFMIIFAAWFENAQP